MKIIKALLIVMLTTIILLVVYWAVMPNSSPTWTGFGTYDGKVLGPQAKTLWDWMGLLIVPVVLSIGIWWLSKSERDAEREIAKQKDITERQIAEERQWQTTLEAYYDRMTDLLLHENLRSAKEAQTIARARTLAVMQALDSGRKGQVISFLYESGLLGKENPIINLRGIDLVGTNLEMAKLPEANLSYAQLNKANLRSSDLSKADLTGTQLMESDLKDANLAGATLFQADLSKAIMEDSKLDNCNLTVANLSGANLRGANLPNATLNDANLEGADLRDTNFNGAKLINANLNRAQLNSYCWETQLQGANLMGANLVNANLNKVNLTKANLIAANMMGVTLKGANLRGAHLSDDNYLTVEVLKQVKSLDGAILPNGTKHDGRVFLNKISREDILRAIKEISQQDADDSPTAPRPTRPYASRFATYKGDVYALRFLIPRAYESDNGLPCDIFDEDEAEKHLTALGFKVERFTLSSILSGGNSDRREIGSGPNA